MHKNSIDVNGTEMKLLCNAAKELKLIICMGINEKVTKGIGSGTIYNSFVIINEKGEIVNHHRKLVPTFSEKLVYGNGDAAGLKTINTYREKLGGIAATIIGIVNIVLVVYVVGATGAERYDAGVLFEYFSKSPLALSVAWIFIVMTSILVYAVITVVADLVESVNRDWTRFATLYGIAGFTVMGVWVITIARLMPELSSNYVAGDQAAKMPLSPTACTRLTLMAGSVLADPAPG